MHPVVSLKTTLDKRRDKMNSEIITIKAKHLTGQFNSVTFILPRTLPHIRAGLLNS